MRRYWVWGLPIFKLCSRIIEIRIGRGLISLSPAPHFTEGETEAREWKGLAQRYRYRAGLEAGIPNAQLMAGPSIQVLNTLPWNYDTEASVVTW